MKKVNIIGMLAISATFGMVGSCWAVDCAAYAREALASGKPREMFAAGMYLDRLYDEVPRQDCRAQALPLIAKAVKEGEPGALFQLGRMYAQQEKISVKHYARGLHYWQKAAEAGDSNAMTMLAVSVEQAIPVKMRKDDAHQTWFWYSQAAAKQNKVALARIAPVREKLERAKRTYEMSAKDEEDLAAAYLGEEYAKGGRSAAATYRQIDEEIQAGLGKFAGRKLRDEAQIIKD